MRSFLLLLLLALPMMTTEAQTAGFGACKPVAQRSSELGCWILTDQSVGRLEEPEVYWHLDSYPDSAQAAKAKGPHGVVLHALNKTWLMTIDPAAHRTSPGGTHVADIGPLRIHSGAEYATTFMEAVMMPGGTSAVHRHSGPEAWYTVEGETCLETPEGRIVGSAAHNAIVPEGPPMFLTAIGKEKRRGITLILHDAAKPPTTMEQSWKPKGLCK